jgi:hypothetical protein
MQKNILYVAALIPAITLSQPANVVWYELATPDHSARASDWGALREKYISESCKPVDLSVAIQRAEGIAKQSSLLKLETIDGPKDKTGKVNKVDLATYAKTGSQDWELRKTQYFYRSKSKCDEDLKKLVAAFDKAALKYNKSQDKYR